MKKSLFDYHFTLKGKKYTVLAFKPMWWIMAAVNGLICAAWIYAVLLVVMAV